jgi:hypothetical protein
LAGLRAQLTALTFGCALLSEAEQLRANHNIYECEDVARLTRWLVNTRRERARRQEVRATVGDKVAVTALALADTTSLPLDNETSASIRYATNEQKERIVSSLNVPHITKAQKTSVLLRLNQLTEPEAPLLLLQFTLPPPFIDRAATKRESRVAFFSRGLTYADLVRC